MSILAGKRAVVTGGNGGIGSTVCRRLVHDGAQIVINYLHDPDRANALATELNNLRNTSVATTIKADISIEEDVEHLFRAAIEDMGGVDILVNNAGIESTFSALELPMHEWDRVIHTNLRGAFMCARATAQAIVRQKTGGVIVNLSSIHESVPRLGLTHYAVSKAGLQMMTKSLALEWAEHDIRVVGVSAGAIETDMNQDEISMFGRQKFEEWIPLGRLGTVADIANAIAYLVSDAASYITGTTLTIDGGYVNNLVRYDPREKQ